MGASFTFRANADYHPLILTAPGRSRCNNSGIEPL
jgi:hypothetical protein